MPGTERWGTDPGHHGLQPGSIPCRPRPPALPSVAPAPLARTVGWPWSEGSVGPGPTGHAVRRVSWAGVWAWGKLVQISGQQRHVRRACMQQHSADAPRDGERPGLRAPRSPGACVAQSGLCCELTSHVCDHMSIKLSFRWARALLMGVRPPGRGPASVGPAGRWVGWGCRSSPR